MDASTGEIRIWASIAYVPQGWHMCDGTQLSVQTYPALFALIGTLYGGDGVKTFALPNLYSRVPIGSGKAAESGTVYNVANNGGAETVALSENNYPAHTHAITALSDPATTTTPAGNMLATVTPNGSTLGFYGLPFTTGSTTSAAAPMAAQAVTSMAAGGTPHLNTMPSLALNYIICLEGTFPDRP